MVDDTSRGITNMISREKYLHFWVTDQCSLVWHIMNISRSKIPGYEHCQGHQDWLLLPVCIPGFICLVSTFWEVFTSITMLQLPERQWGDPTQIWSWPSWPYARSYLKQTCLSVVLLYMLQHFLGPFYWVEGRMIWRLVWHGRLQQHQLLSFIHHIIRSVGEIVHHNFHQKKVLGCPRSHSQPVHSWSHIVVIREVLNGANSSNSRTSERKNKNC